MKYALFLLLLSCGAPGHEYMRGTMVAPPPAPVRPGVGAPIRGQPGEPHAYPRSPHTRVLPETPETRHGPGIWAADVTARGERDDDHPNEQPGRPQIFGIPLPIDTPEIAQASQACADDMRFAALHTKQDIEKWPRPQRACAAMRLYLLCTHDHAAQFERAGGEWTKQANRLRELGLARRDAACTGTNMFIVNERFADDVFNTYLRQTGRGR